jgi:hypothetical protein
MLAALSVWPAREMPGHDLRPGLPEMRQPALLGSADVKEKCRREEVVDSSLWWNYTTGEDGCGTPNAAADTTCLTHGSSPG